MITDEMRSKFHDAYQRALLSGRRDCVDVALDALAPLIRNAALEEARLKLRAISATEGNDDTRYTILKCVDDIWSLKTKEPSDDHP
jgi:hypothetical protein